MLREDFLQQSAFSDTDAFCPLEKQYYMLKAIIAFHEAAAGAINRGVSLRRIMDLPLKTDIGRMKEAKDVEMIKGMIDGMGHSIAALEAEK